MKKAVITGGMGFVGQRLTAMLLREGVKVKILSRALPADAEELPFEVARVDYNDISALAKEFEGADVIYHLAAAIFAFNKEEFERANVELTQNITQAAVKAGVKSFVYLSSQAAAGPCRYKNNPCSESDAPAPVSDYGITKLKAEEFVLALPEDMYKVVLRAPIVYGKDDSGVSKIAAWVKRGIMVNTGSAGMFFSFVYVDDLVRALFTAPQRQEANGQVYFVCEPEGYSWNYFINSMADAMKRPRPFMFSLPYFMLEISAFVYEIIARVFGVAPALNYDKIKEAAVKGHWLCTSKKWIALTGQTFTPLSRGLEESFK